MSIYSGEEIQITAKKMPYMMILRVALLILVYAGEHCLSGPVPAYTQAEIVVLVGAIMDMSNLNALKSWCCSNFIRPTHQRMR